MTMTTNEARAELSKTTLLDHLAPGMQQKAID